MKHGGRRRKWTEENAIEALRSLGLRLGRTPFAREIGTTRCPSIRVFRRYFGTMRAAMLLAGLTPNPEGGRAIHPGKIRHPEKRHMALVPIDPAKADAVTRAKRDYWSELARGKHGLSGWTHPYARRRAS